MKAVKSHSQSTNYLYWWFVGLRIGINTEKSDKNRVGEIRKEISLKL